MIIISFELTMPNVGSWNGKWSGADSKYFIVRTFTKKFFTNTLLPLFDGKNHQNWYYNFGDGWGANVRAEIIDSKTASQRRKLSKGFCGYEWMVESIIHCGRILTSDKRKQYEKEKEEVK